jgi:hypothetical protein
LLSCFPGGGRATEAHVRTSASLLDCAEIWGKGGGRFLQTALPMTVLFCLFRETLQIIFETFLLEAGFTLDILSSR